MKNIKTIGILGGGQLGQMLGLAATPLGLNCIFYDKAASLTEGNEKPPAAATGPIYKNFNNFARDADIFTYEFENVSLTQAHKLSGADGKTNTKLNPSIKALNVSSNRYFEKSLFHSLGINSHAWKKLSSIDDMQSAAIHLGFPFVVKTCCLGYDGKGQTIIKDERELKNAQKKMFESPEARKYIQKFNIKIKESQDLTPFKLKSNSNLSPGPYIAEKFVKFKRELSLISVRSINGELLHYPIAENLHRNGVLYLTRAPAKVPPSQTQKLHKWMELLLNELSYVGVLALEIFDSTSGLCANEIAPRVHNSGHWTIEGSVTSQFENHIRAISGMRLGRTSTRGFSLMLNLIGKVNKSQLNSDGHLHLYGKQPRAGRKLGHITWNALSQEAVEKRAATLIY